MVNPRAYGTWDFRLNKVSETARPHVQFISDAVSNFIYGYFLEISTTEQIQLIERSSAVDTVLFSTAAAYVAANTEYEYRITRDPMGKFAVYIRGGAFTTWTLVDTTGGSGTNPVVDTTHTAGNFIVIDADAGDIVSPVAWRPGVHAPA